MLYYFLPILLASFVLSACTPKTQQPVDLTINLYGLEQDTSLTNSKTITVDSRTQSADITLVSAFNQSNANVVNNYNYVYALNSGEGLQNAPLLASNLPIVGISSKQEVYDFANNKTHAKVYVKEVSGQKVAFLALIDLDRTKHATPSKSDLDKLGATIDRGSIEGWNKVVLVSQYSPSTTAAVLQQLKGIDLAITLGPQRKTTQIGKSCLAEFPFGDDVQLPIKASFSANGYTTQCHW
ncbi:hypothetical protein [Vibrio rumoiensis]|uniref:Uncharacterized protein n=1 Tax=Vibrio rumoiensis 1S-45 TaxID=1188252 RepID=A0A1E5E492_9VIBR|nr:hypothetical protein [Vibrio rumoiensis]OEF27555.1 hypothetical protein A1QC_06430 [Vibrio rumoiensis 1S-45]